MVLESKFMAETIFGGFVSKVVNNVWDVSWEEIKKADNNRADKNQSFQTRIYQIIIDVLNLMTQNQYKEKDIVYDTAEKLLKAFKTNSSNSDVIKPGLKNLITNADDNICQEFIRLLYHELGEEKNFDLYKEILLLLVNEKSNHTNEELQHIQSKLNYVIQRLDENNILEQDIQKNDKIHLIKSRTQEYADKWNENMFLNDFDKRDENVGVNVKLSEVYFEEHLPHYIWKSNKSTRNDLKDLLKEYIYPNNVNKMLIILGQPGIGKSTLVTWIVANFIDKIEDILVYKFSSDLKNIRWKHDDSDDDFTEALMDELKLSYENLNQKIIILDGFDEIRVKIKRGIILNRLYWKLIKESDLKNFTLIITSRENDIDGLGLIGCAYITLLPWDKKQIQSFYTTYKQKIGDNMSINTLECILEKESILGIPLILYMTLALNIIIEKESSIVDIYDQIFSLKGGIYDRCVNEGRYDGLHRISDIKEQIHQISREIAIWMFENNSEEAVITYCEYEKICNNVMKRQAKADVEVKHDFLIGNFFKRVKHCDAIEGEELYFVHRSIYEYFVAEYIFVSILDNINKPESLAGQLGYLLKGNSLSKEIRKFLKHKISYSRLNYMVEYVNETFQLMLQNGMTYYINQHFRNVIICELNIFYNMLEIVHLWKKNSIKFDSSICKYLNYSSKFSANLANMDLSGINLSYADLSGANLLGAKLRNTNLNNSNLQKSKLYGAHLDNAKLIGANLTEASFLDAYLDGIELEDASLKGTVFSMDQIMHLGTKYDIRRDRVITNHKLESMKDLTLVEDTRDVLSQSEIDALLAALSSSTIDDEMVSEIEAMREEKIKVEAFFEELKESMNAISMEAETVSSFV